MYNKLFSAARGPRWCPVPCAEGKGGGGHIAQALALERLLLVTSTMPVTQVPPRRPRLSALGSVNENPPAPGPPPAGRQVPAPSHPRGLPRAMPTIPSHPTAPHPTHPTHPPTHLSYSTTSSTTTPPRPIPPSPLGLRHNQHGSLPTPSPQIPAHRSDLSLLYPGSAISFRHIPFHG